LKLLLDTHALLWSYLNDPKLSITAKSLILDPASEQTLEVVNEGEADAALDEDGFDGLFRSLLRIEAEIFEHRAHCTAFSESEVTSRAIQPFARIGRRIAFTRHRRPCPLAKPDR